MTSCLQPVSCQYSSSKSPAELGERTIFSSFSMNVVSGLFLLEPRVVSFRVFSASEMFLNYAFFYRRKVGKMVLGLVHWQRSLKFLKAAKNGK